MARNIDDPRGWNPALYTRRRPPAQDVATRPTTAKTMQPSLAGTFPAHTDFARRVDAHPARDRSYTSIACNAHPDPRSSPMPTPRQ